MRHNLSEHEGVRIRLTLHIRVLGIIRIISAYPYSVIGFSDSTPAAIKAKGQLAFYVTFSIH